MNDRRSAFTLVELMIVVMILAILAGISLGGLQAARDSAAKMRTKSTINKLHRFVMEKYASYQYRSVPAEGATTAERARNRLTKIRYLQRCEMPDHASEIDTLSPHDMQHAKTTLGNSDLECAELLYMIVMSMPGADVSFGSNESADTNQNGLREFIDGWGRPIMYLRWPAGFIVENGAITQFNDIDAHDPFDAMNVDGAYAVFPLIYSSGPDGERGIVMSANSTSPCGNTQTGCPGSGDGASDTAGDTARYMDNITNHNLD
ncbi:MAG: type II secretion system protein [Planctomycetia bacterium]|nr:type II secretion system protein [Planctomycetia bacterium]